MHIELLSMKDVEALFAFERKNREYFSKVGFPRRPEYYKKEIFLKQMKELIQEQEKDEGYYYLVKEGSLVIGRININNVLRGPWNKAEIGYRMDEKVQGRGHASQGVHKVIERARQIHKLHRLEAGTSSDNLGSQKVLENNGFRYVGTYYKFMLQGETWVDARLYELLL